MTDTPELKPLPCPICGKGASTSRVYHNPKADNPKERELWKIVHNANWGCPVNFDRGFASESSAIEAWNSRPAPEPAKDVGLWCDPDAIDKTEGEKFIIEVHPIEGVSAWSEPQLAHAYWTDFNDGGFVWEGALGKIKRCIPLERPALQSQASADQIDAFRKDKGDKDRETPVEAPTPDSADQIIAELETALKNIRKIVEIGSGDLGKTGRLKRIDDIAKDALKAWREAG